MKGKTFSSVGIKNPQDLVLRIVEEIMKGNNF
jgi:hypothetical protein